MRITDPAPSADAIEPPRTVDLGAKPDAVSADAARSGGASETGAARKASLESGDLAPAVRDALASAGLSGADATPAEDAETLVSNMLDIAFHAAEAAREGETFDAVAALRQADAPLSDSIEACVGAVVDAAVDVLQAADQGDYSEAGSSLREAVADLRWALVDAFGDLGGHPAVGAPAAPRMINVAA